MCGFARPLFPGQRRPLIGSLGRGAGEDPAAPLLSDQPQTSYSAIETAPADAGAAASTADSMDRLAPKTWHDQTAIVTMTGTSLVFSSNDSVRVRSSGPHDAHGWPHMRAHDTAVCLGEHASGPAMTSTRRVAWRRRCGRSRSSRSQRRSSTRRWRRTATPAGPVPTRRSPVRPVATLHSMVSARATSLIAGPACAPRLSHSAVHAHGQVGGQPHGPARRGEGAAADAAPAAPVAGA